MWVGFASSLLTQDFSTSDSYILDECTKNHSFARCRGWKRKKEARAETTVERNIVSHFKARKRVHFPGKERLSKLLGIAHSVLDQEETKARIWHRSAEKQQQACILYWNLENQWFYCAACTLGQKSAIYPKKSLFTKFTISKSHFFSQNSQFQNLIFHKIHNLKISFFTKFPILKSQFSQNSQFLNLIFHTIHKSKISFFTKFTFLKYQNQRYFCTKSGYLLQCVFPILEANTRYILPKKVLLVLVLRSPTQREVPQKGFKDQVSLGWNHFWETHE